jgi:hypothetical protein
MRTAEQRCREVFQDSMTITELMKAANCSRSAASKYRRLLLAEQQQQEEIAQ